ncbi:tyrosine-protein phosphatase [Paenibacillus spongiae]|uniref:Tyrosine-protein phosphatase n=1 Tax=Paenibacillus spongiae TaxID=2909671 RepID=A0ABY5S207_9BACL|nr:CpsB/CapC family capsule biosynthesis tyrosine phosphatase [Paenibacillus spongiae]UVI27911.1 tyrosine protein phosphatase [Paenibacillus spongiae]
MIDLHCHLLHGLDDGPTSLEESISLAQSAVDDGATTIYATPHYRAGRYDTEAADIRERTGLLNAELRKRQIPLRVLPGQEIRVYDGLLDDLEEGKLLPLGESTYLLLEFSASNVPARFDDTLHELRIAGWTPIIAHPERNAELAADPDKLKSLVDNGALCQVTSHSLTGRFGSKVKSAAIEMCRRNLIHFIASDSHNGTTRPFELRSAYEVAETKLGQDTIAYYERNARAVIHNLEVQPKPTLYRKRQLRLFAGWSPFKTQDGG